MKKYDDKMAPNAGYGGSSEPMHKKMKHMAEDHGSGVALSGKQHITNNAMTKDWDGMAYSQMQHGDGSMQYMGEKKSIASSDAVKLSRTRKKDVE